MNDMLPRQFLREPSSRWESGGLHCGAEDDHAVTEELLTSLAMHCDLAGEVPFLAAVLSHDGFTVQELRDAWYALVEAIRWREALATGSRHWAEVYDEADLPRGGSPSEAALDLACMVADEALHHFLAGGPR